MDERGRVPVCEPPSASLPPEDEGYSQGPVLVREVADFTVLPFDGHKDDEIAGRVGLDDLDVRIAAMEEARRGFQRLVRGVEATSRLPAEGLEQGLVARVSDECQVPADVSADQR